MKKDTLRTIIVAVIALVLYNLVVFLIPFDRTEVFWISYGFTMAAFVVVCAAIYIAFIKNPDAKSRFYGFPIARIALIYGAVQLVVSLIVMVLEYVIPGWICILLFALGMGAALLGLISVEAVVDQIQTQDVKLKKDTSLMRNLQSKVIQLAAQSDNAAIKALAEEFRFSDPVSNAAISDAEADLAAAVYELQSAFVDGDHNVVAQLCHKASVLLAERNRLCKLNKK